MCLPIVKDDEKETSNQGYKMHVELFFLWENFREAYHRLQALKIVYLQATKIVYYRLSALVWKRSDIFAQRAKPRTH